MLGGCGKVIDQEVLALKLSFDEVGVIDSLDLSQQWLWFLILGRFLVALLCLAHDLGERFPFEYMVVEFRGLPVDLFGTLLEYDADF